MVAVHHIGTGTGSDDNDQPDRGQDPTPHGQHRSGSGLLNVRDRGTTAGTNAVAPSRRSRRELPLDTAIRLDAADRGKATVETKRIELSTPALQRRCSAN